jgi:nicotinate-nucleotide adenylyltransferase
MKIAKKQTIIYGGAFNPPTKAHQAILQACIDRAELTGADVWVMPCGNRVHKTIDVPYDTRIKYVNALVNDVAWRSVDVRIETTELNSNDVNVETYDTAVSMNKQYPDRHFVWVFGTDSVATIEQWKEGEWLKQHLPMLVVQRPNSPEVTLGQNAEWLATELSTISSTEVRLLLDSQESVEHLVTPSVLEYLQP